MAGGLVWVRLHVGDALRGCVRNTAPRLALDVAVLRTQPLKARGMVGALTDTLELSRDFARSGSTRWSVVWLCVGDIQRQARSQRKDRPLTVAEREKHSKPQTTQALHN
jgi:hypothetical protein